MLALLCCLMMTDDPQGVFVNPDKHHERIEFAADGVCFDYGGRGSWSQQQSTITCVLPRYGRRRFTWTGKALIDEDNNTWLPRLQIQRPPLGDLSAVTLNVASSETAAAVPKFAIDYQIVTQFEEYDPLLVRPLPVENEQGKFVLQAPDSCEIRFCISGEGIPGGYGSWKTVQVKRADKEREFTISVRHGKGLAGQVVDADTAAPIPGAELAPMMFTPPDFTPDWNAAVVADDQGRFQIRGDFLFGIAVRHADYARIQFGGFGEEGQKQADGRVQIRLKRGVSVTGRVQTTDGRPLDGIGIHGGRGKFTYSNSQGEFRLRGALVSNGAVKLSFSGDKYRDKQLTFPADSPEKLQVVLEPRPPLPRLTGTVRGPDGQMVPSFTVQAGSGKEPQSWKCTEQTVVAGQQFDLSVDFTRDYDETGVVWVGVAAPGFEMWETTVAFWQGTHNVEVNLQAGQVVSGRVDVARELRQGLTATLLPVRRVSNELFVGKVSTRQSMMRQNVTLDQAQRFEFSHVRPGDYVLAVHGPEVSPVSQNVTVGSEPCIVQPIRLGPRGIVMGVIKDSREDDGVWAFADGSIRFSDSAGRDDENDFPHLRSLSFRTDEKGRFRVPRVPVGRVTVEFRYHMTADIISRHQKEAVVRGREITEVIFEDVAPPNQPAPQGGVILR